ncbi:MAG: hypothetical protein ABIP48_07370 [Planctomycetota bacterium]
MFLELAEFCRGLLSHHPSVAMVTWASQPALDSFVARLRPALRGERTDTILSRRSAADLDSVTVHEQLLAGLDRRDGSKRCLLVYGIEPLAPAAARTLNGFRERLVSLRAVIVAIRENRKRDFVTDCPDLMDWVGTSVARAEDLAPPMTLRDVNAAVRRFEERFGITSKEFLEEWSRGQMEATDDHWLWNDLLAVRAGLKTTTKP